MCGIVGTIDKKLNQDVVELIHHRGPDSNGLEHYELGKRHVFFGHTRLSIQDLSAAGAQPMSTPDGKYSIIFNGEVYNHFDLRAKVSDVNWRGHSDTETLLHYLAQKGIQGVADFNGIFAFAFLDHSRGKLYLARDPYGVKPLYYTQDSNGWSWSSELKTLRAIDSINEIDENAMYQFLKLRYVPAPHTIWKGISKLEPGHYLCIELNNLNYKKEFYSYTPNVEYNILEQDALVCYDEMLNRAVERQLLSDVPIAMLLSGGVDSGLLCHLAQELGGEKIDTFTAGFDIDTDANELEEARESAKFLGSRHHEVILREEDFFSNFEKFISIVEEPNGSSSIFPIYFLSKAIHDAGFKVALTGQGVDEPWAGYGRYNVQNFIDKVPRGITPPLRMLKSLSLGDKVRRGLNAVLENDRITRFIESYSLFDDSMIMALCGDRFSRDNYLELHRLIEKRYELYDLDDLSAVKAMSSMDLRMNLSDDLLLYTDKISMYHALELRVPFLDTELTHFVECLPDRMKVDMFNNKILHKKLARKYLPDGIIYRKKKGFYTPQNEWFKSSRSYQLQEEMSASNTLFGSFFSESYIASLFNAHREGKVNYEKQLYLLTVLHYWFKAQTTEMATIANTQKGEK
ncbi:MAG: asparagine synthase (glutamine-hydrolyzing) [Flavobacteriales bacterium]|nr:asparagine synthase (glutamine-hydrolyzing) [Flavobacteriales bacterium]